MAAVPAQQEALAGEPAQLLLPAAGMAAMARAPHTGKTCSRLSEPQTQPVHCITVSPVHTSLGLIRGALSWASSFTWATWALLLAAQLTLNHPQLLRESFPCAACCRGAGAIARNEAPPRIVPIASLNSYQNHWTIKARITQKSDIKRYSNARGEGER